jgi:hypothetical protein
MLLAGCGLFSDEPPPCPAITIVDQARALTLYRDGPGRDLSDVTFEVELVNVVARCTYDIDDDGSGVVDMEFILLVQATRGPAAEAESVSVPYFVAISDPRRRIVAKEVFTVTLPFGEADVRTQVSDEIEQRIPLRPGAIGPAYETFLGLQFTRSQLEEERRLNER